MPNRASAIPTEDSTRYFHTASSDRRSCRWYTSGASASVVVSIPTQTSARWWLIATSVAAARNARRQLTKTRPPRGVSVRRNPTAYTATTRNSTLTSVSTTSPSGSTASQPPSAGAAGRTQKVADHGDVYQRGRDQPAAAEAAGDR